MASPPATIEDGLFPTWPRDDAHRLQGVLDHRELPQDLGRHAGTGLVARPQLVAERLDDVVGGHTQMRDAAFEHGQHARDNAPGGAEADTVGGLARRHPEVMAEQFVGAVDEVDLHTPSPLAPSPRRLQCARQNASRQRDGALCVVAWRGDQPRQAARAVARNQSPALYADSLARNGNGQHALARHSTMAGIRLPSR